MEECLDILNGSKSIRSWNNTNIVLIPKKSDPKDVSDFRPISLCNVNYKIVTKTIANRLKLVLKDIISESQSALIQGRSITDNIIIGHECINALRNNKVLKDNMAALKIDLSKAYDRVEWPYLKEIMLKLGFDIKLVNLIMNCISFPNFSILINGEQRGSFVSYRGLRQGAPLSPYLFLIVVEGLSHLITVANSRALLSGLSVSGGPRISHLLFADDSLIFCKADERELVNLKNILKIYELASGESINYTKSAILFSTKVNKDRGAFLSSILGVKLVEDFGSYLGVPSIFSRSKAKDFSYVLDKIWKSVQGWKRSFLSVAGKELLIKSIGQAIPSDAMSVFRFPRGLCDEITRNFARFWWGSKENKRKLHWCSWDKLCLPKSLGGLNFRDLEGFNKALIAKQVWRMVSSPNSLVSRFIKSIYFSNGNILEAEEGRNPSFHCSWEKLVMG